MVWGRLSRAGQEPSTMASSMRVESFWAQSWRHLMHMSALP